jgi:hypothetical protein
MASALRFPMRGACLDTNATTPQSHTICTSLPSPASTPVAHFPIISQHAPSLPWLHERTCAGPTSVRGRAASADSYPARRAEESHVLTAAAVVPYAEPAKDKSDGDMAGM